MTQNGTNLYIAVYEGHYLHRGKSEEEIDEKPEKIDPKVQKEIEELSKITDSGVGKVILKGKPAHFAISFSYVTLNHQLQLRLHWAGDCL